MYNFNADYMKGLKTCEQVFILNILVSKLRFAKNILAVKLKKKKQYKIVIQGKNDNEVIFHKFSPHNVL